MNQIFSKDDLENMIENPEAHDMELWVSLAKHALTLRRADAGDEEVEKVYAEAEQCFKDQYDEEMLSAEDRAEAAGTLIDCTRKLHSFAIARGQQLRDERDRSRRLNVTCDELHESIREKESEIEKCHDQVVKAESLVLTVQAENGQLEKQLRSSREEVERMKEQIASSDESLRLERSITDQQHQEQRDELVGLLKKCDKWFGLTDKMIVLKNSFGTDLESLQDASKFLEIVSAGEVAK